MVKKIHKCAKNKYLQKVTLVMISTIKTDSKNNSVELLNIKITTTIGQSNWIPNVLQNQVVVFLTYIKNNTVQIIQIYDRYEDKYL